MPHTVRIAALGWTVLTVAEYKCGKDKCIHSEIHGHDCDRDYYPSVSYECYRSKDKWASERYDKTKKNKKQEEKKP